MAGPVPVRPDLAELAGYHSPQVDVEVRLNTNESPLAPPEAWLDELRAELGRVAFNRYPDREARDLRVALGRFHGLDAAQVFCANGSNEALQCLLLAYGGRDRTVAVFEPTYALHSHIASLTATTVASAWRAPDYSLDLDAVDRVLEEAQPVITFLCSPNNPTGRAEPPEVLRHVLERAPGLVVVDEAYGQFAPTTALDMLHGDASSAERLVVVRTFSKTWSMAACRLGYLMADPAVVGACESVTLPYHLDAVTQVAGRLALAHVPEMEQRVALITEERGRIAAGLADLAIEAWPSDANFILFRPLRRGAKRVWQDLLDASILVRDCSTWPGLDDCLRVTVGTPAENDRFLEALRASLADAERRR
ncbi:MAG TPA: histidinol-phosphate transaminase [Acidimicrobiales bacterium]|nr:histidinol-phosphate transaminase [Acidimicrobiales bacterium]